MSGFTELRSLVKGLLEDTVHIGPDGIGIDWTLQGFGMLRKHISDECRLNIWDDRYAIDEYKDGSSIHTHPWDFTSTIVSGTLIDQIWTVESRQEGIDRCVDITPGTGGGAKIEPYSVAIVAASSCSYRSGAGYSLKHDVFHRSVPSRGTITVNTRTRVGEDEAKVAWFGDGPWISAEPRAATDDEVFDIVSNALTLMDSNP